MCDSSVKTDAKIVHFVGKTGISGVNFVLWVVDFQKK